MSMFSATFLGWQGWLLAAENTHVLVDPLLDERVGCGPPSTRQTFLTYPPRRFDRIACPPIDALVLSHEHEDHFNISSLVQLDRAIPVILSARSSIAARAILGEMGFDVHLLYPGSKMRIGAIELCFFTPDNVAAPSWTDEWDTLAYLFRHVDGHGAFFSNVDVEFTPRMREVVAAEKCAVLVYEAMSLGLWSEHFAHSNSSELHRPSPQAQLSDDIVQALTDRMRVRPLPGQTIVMRDGRISASAPSTTYLRTLPRDQWGPQPAFWRKKDEPVQPVTAPFDPNEEEIAELETGLARLAEYMYGRDVFRRLHSLSAPDLQEHVPSMLWVLYTTDTETVLAYEYQAHGCRFIALDDLQKSYAGVVSCWAGDLLRLFRGEFEPRCLVKGCRESWVPAWGSTSFLMSTLWPYFHPLRHPEKCLARYRRALAEEPRRELLFTAASTSP